MPIPAPPADNSGGYAIVVYTNGSDIHRARFHFRPIGTDAAYTAPSASVNPNVMADFTALYNKVKLFYNNAWTFKLDSIFRNNGDGTFTELFGWTPPATITGSGATATTTNQERASQTMFNFKTGFGGRGRLTMIGAPGDDLANRVLVGGNPAGTGGEQIVDLLSTATKSNIVAHDGHVMQSPAALTWVINRRLRRHYGFA